MKNHIFVGYNITHLLYEFLLQLPEAEKLLTLSKVDKLQKLVGTGI